MNIVSQILIRLSSDLIGEDQYGNKYYSQKKTDKRYVIFNGKVEASKIPPMWHAWLHKIISKPPLKRKFFSSFYLPLDIIILPIMSVKLNDV